MPEQDRRPPSAFWSVSTKLMLTLAACFTVQQIVVVYLEKPYQVYLALSDYGMKSGHLWELFTYQFFHSFQSSLNSLVHLLVNLAGLWFVGRALESRLGAKRFLRLYLAAVLAGALLQGVVAVAFSLLPDSLQATAVSLGERFGGPVAGSSVGLCGVFGAFCRMEPDTKIRLLFLIPIRLAVLGWIALGLAVLLIVVRTDPSVAHLAHLGGLLAGRFLVRPGRRRCGEGSPHSSNAAESQPKEDAP